MFQTFISRKCDKTLVMQNPFLANVSTSSRVSHNSHSKGNSTGAALDLQTQDWLLGLTKCSSTTTNKNIKQQRRPLLCLTMLRSVSMYMSWICTTLRWILHVRWTALLDLARKKCHGVDINLQVKLKLPQHISIIMTIKIRKSRWKMGTRFHLKTHSNNCNQLL